MIFEFLGFTWSVILSFITAPWTLATGSISLLSVAGTLGLVLLLVAAVLIIRHPEAHGRWLLPLALAGCLSPAILWFARASMGWFGMLFALVLGLAGLLVWTGMLANDADRRAPFWFTGLGVMSFTGYAGLVGIIIVWSGS
jgi:hypothetical protein